MLKDFGIDAIYIVHAKSGYEVHEQRINDIFGKLHLDYEFVSDGDISNFNPGLLQKYFCNEIDSVLSKGVLSCTLNHIICYEKIVKNQNRYALVFENDPFFLGDFLKKIKLIANEANSLEPGFIISLENTTLKFPDFRKVKKGKYLYEASYGRAAGAYLIDLKGAKDILENVKTNKCCQVIDWWHNTLIDNKVIRMYWAHPAFVEQGSHNGLMSSTISSKNKSYGRRFRWNAQKFYKMYIYRWFKKH
ncbi:MAG TPA: glycosyltransferase family 25 protein [Hanamia sp.]|nr:glycosyltransferase family 25 protein [Hanamia sp.]